MIQFKQHHEVTPGNLIVILILLVIGGYAVSSIMIDFVDNYLCQTCQELFDLVFGKLIQY